VSRCLPAPAELSMILTVLRAARGWSQQELARAAGIQASSISNYDEGVFPRASAARELFWRGIGK
jgi:transcriptional regulator with XRE-family HTH domain